MPSVSIPIADARPVRLWRRFASMLYDLFPLIALWIIAAGLWMLVFYRAEGLQQLASEVQGPFGLVLRDLWLLLVTAAYFVVSWMRVGATVGMRAWRIRVVRGDGGKLDVRAASLRFGLALVSLAALGCGFWYAWFDVEHRTWHDRVCGTRVVRL